MKKGSLCWSWISFQFIIIRVIHLAGLLIHCRLVLKYLVIFSVFVTIKKNNCKITPKRHFWNQVAELGHDRISLWDSQHNRNSCYSTEIIRIYPMIQVQNWFKIQLVNCIDCLSLWCKLRYELNDTIINYGKYKRNLKMTFMRNEDRYMRSVRWRSKYRRLSKKASKRWLSFV